MKAGYTKAWRRELFSDIWKMPPIYHRVFYFLRQKANWDTKLLPTVQTPKMGIWVSPGTMITSYDIIAEGVSYIEYGVDRVPNRKTIMMILDWLQDREMIKKESNARGTIIYIINWDIYQSNDDEKVTKKKQYKDIETDTYLDNYLDTTKTLIPLKRIKEKEPKPLSDKTDSIPFEIIIGDLNKKAGTSYKPTTKDTRSHIRARWNDGFREKDFFQVHDTMCAKWLDDPKMRPYLRPITLYGNKFEGYLNAIVSLSDRGIISQKTEKGIASIDRWRDREREKQSGGNHA